MLRKEAEHSKAQHNYQLFIQAKDHFSILIIQMSSSEGKYDIVVFGATGFTGEYVVEEIARTIEAEKLTWAVAGRNMAKLQKTLSSASQHTGEIMS